MIGSSQNSKINDAPRTMLFHRPEVIGRTCFTINQDAPENYPLHLKSAFEQGDLRRQRVVCARLETRRRGSHTQREHELVRCHVLRAAYSSRAISRSSPTASPAFIFASESNHRRRTGGKRRVFCNGKISVAAIIFQPPRFPFPTSSPLALR